MFALTNLPEVVKGALFARYSRTTKSLRRLFLDEFAEDVGRDGRLTRAGEARAAKLYERVFVEYGDDSVAQLGGVHLACEQASQLLCKALEWGRLAAYLEQSTRYMRYDDRPGGAWRATVPPRSRARRSRTAFRDVPGRAFGAYGRLYEPMEAYYRERFPKDDGRLRLRVPPDDHGQDVRHAAAAAARPPRGRTWGSTRRASPTNSC